MTTSIKAQRHRIPGVIIMTPLIQEALRLGGKITLVEEHGVTPVGDNPPSPGFISLLLNADKVKVPHMHMITEANLAWALMVVGEMKQLEKFINYRTELEDKRVIVSNLEDNALAKIVKPSDASRYFQGGRKRIKGKIFKRLGHWFNCPGLLLSLTFAPEKISRAEAWKRVGELRREFMDRVNRWRKRHGMSKAKFLSVIEVQPGTGYPHVHMVFPKLKRLAPINWMTEQWGQESNSVDCKIKDSMSPVSYICKYISKLDGWSDWALSYIWTNRTRLYSMSRDYVLPDYSEKRLPEWCFSVVTTKEKLFKHMPQYRLKYHTILEDGGAI